MSTLQEQIAARKNEAWEKRIGQKAKTIAQVLGEDRKPHRGSWHVFEDSRIKIEVLEARERHDEDYASTWTGIMVDGASVYDWSGDTVLDDRARYAGTVGLTCYIPGDWERQLDALYDFAFVRKASTKKLAATAAAVQQAVDEQAERKKWGL